MRALRPILATIGIATLAVLSHREVREAAPGFVNADTATFPLTADLMNQGHWSYFGLQDTYGGVTLTVARAAWNFLFFDDSTSGHFAFNFVLLTILFALLAFLVAQAHCTFLSSVAVGATTATGLNSLLLLYGIDFHIAALLVGLLVLLFAAKHPKPWGSLGPLPFLVLGLAGGLALYTSRMTAVFVAAYLVPWGGLLKEWKARFGAKDGLDRALFFLGCCLVGIFFYLQAFGGTLGVWRGKPVKLHADPNLHLAAVVWGALWLRRRHSSVSRANVMRTVLLLIGFGAGFSPELISSISRGHGLRSLPTSDLAGMFTGIGQIPGALRGLLAAGPSMLANFSILLGVAAIAAVAMQARVRPALRIPLFSIVLACLVYVVKRPYTEAPPRYLLAILPGVILGIGVFLDWARARPHRLAFACLLLAGHSWSQLQNRSAWMKVVREGGTLETDRKIIEVFRRENVRVVVASDYWDANHRTLLGGWRPQFAGPGTLPSIPASATDLALKEPRVGILARSPTPLSGTIQILGRTFRPKHLATIGAYQLAIATD